jgi:ammonia channel protein AmtB
MPVRAIREAACTILHTSPSPVQGALAIAGTYIILRVVDAVIGLRVTKDEEINGLDTTQHGEEAYSTL